MGTKGKYEPRSMNPTKFKDYQIAQEAEMKLKAVVDGI